MPYNESLNKFYGLTELLLFFVEVSTKPSFLARQIDIQIYDGRGVFINLLSTSLCTTKKTWVLNFERCGNQEIPIFEAWEDVGLEIKT